jgi:hypothetical protein
MAPVVIHWLVQTNFGEGLRKEIMHYSSSCPQSWITNSSSAHLMRKTNVSMFGK